MRRMQISSYPLFFTVAKLGKSAKRISLFGLLQSRLRNNLLFMVFFFAQDYFDFFIGREVFYRV